ncbi:MAG: hypothetical protein WDN29_10345 [Methylovirgula sp.]
MQFDVLKLAAAGFGATLAASLALAPAAQAHEYRHHHHYYHSAYNERPLIVRHHHHYYAPLPSPTILGMARRPSLLARTTLLPRLSAFRSASPIRSSGLWRDPATNPLILVGAPVHVLAQAVTFPFYAVGTVFGAPPRSRTEQSG